MGERRVTIMDAEAVRRAWLRIAHEVWEHHRDPENMVLVGIRRRGEPLARRLADTLSGLASGGRPPVRTAGLDIGPWRDDAAKPPTIARPAQFPDTLDRTVVLVDDVLFTGRSVRAALDALAEFGRPRRVELAVLVDRGHRELPIRADYVGKNVPTALMERVAVHVSEVDGGADGVDLVSWEDAP